jgi:GTP-binding protein EngB required for normal cell division
MSAPIENIHLCFVGGVSTGKSTLLNSIFCEELTQCKIKRTTMVPTVYVECAFNAPRDDTTSIFETIAKKNAEIIAKTERGQTDAADYAEMTYYVAPLDIKILPDDYCMVNVYDIPGLNDARTKDVYYTYLSESFHKFNLVVFMVDIHSGLNTSDEFDIVNFITKNTCLQKTFHDRSVYTLVVVNKADDMQLNEKTGMLEFTGEMQEMFDQVETTIRSEFQSKNVGDNLIGIIPMCAVDAYLYRMVKKYGTNFKLSREQILKIGINENGKKFSTYSSSAQEEKVLQILNDSEFIDTMISLSGFSQFEHTMREFLSKTDASRTMPIQNIEYQLRSLEDITENTPETRLEKIMSLRCNTIAKMRYVCKDKHDTHMNELMHRVCRRIAQLAVSEPSFLQIVDVYDFLWEKYLNSTELSAYLPLDPRDSNVPNSKPIYPEEVALFAKKDIIKILSFQSLTIERIIDCMQYTIKLAKHEYLTEYIDCILSNPMGTSTITINHIIKPTNDNLRVLMNLFDLTVVPRKKVISLIRFILINNLHASTIQQILEKQILFTKYSECVILTYINNQFKPQVPLSYYMNLDIDESSHPLEMFYLDIIFEHDHV